MGTSPWEAVLVPKCQPWKLWLLAGALSAHTEVSRDKSMEKKTAMEEFKGKRTITSSRRKQETCFTFCKVR